MLIDAAALRQDFPALRQPVADRRRIYLDSAYTSYMPSIVQEVLDNYHRQSRRAFYRLDPAHSHSLQVARGTVGSFIGASAEEVVFMRNGTEAINLVAGAWGRVNLRRGDLIVVSRLEHHSNLTPWQLLTREVGAELAFIELLPDGSLDLCSLDRHLATGRVKLVATAHISNVLGTLTPVAEITRRAHAMGSVVLLDAAQSVPHVPVDVRALDVDFVAFTAHKMLGPTGIGVLYGKRSVLEMMPPFLASGSVADQVGYRESIWKKPPARFEPWAPPSADAEALAAAVRYLQGVGMEAVAEHGRTLVRYALHELAQIDGLTIYGPRERGPIVAFTLEGISSSKVAALLGRQGIVIRAGLHNAQPLHQYLSLAATARVSFYLYNAEHEIDTLADALVTLVAKAAGRK